MGLAAVMGIFVIMGIFVRMPVRTGAGSIVMIMERHRFFLQI